MSDKPETHVFDVCGPVTRNDGPVDGEEMRANVSAMGRNMFSVAKQMATQIYNREDVEYHSITVVMAVRTGSIEAIEVSMAQGIGNQDACAILGQVAGTLMTEPEAWRDEWVAVSGGPSRVQ